MGEDKEINKQSHVKFWLNRKKYGAVTYLSSCRTTLKKGSFRMDFFILDHCEGLQNQLGVTVEEPWFPNPYDPARKVLYSYDFWHSIRNLRYVI